LALATVRQDSPRYAPGKLVFRSYGNQHFLAAIWGGAYTRGVLFSPSKQEKQMQRMQQVASGPANTGTETMIALK
jgi:hypothetical protein